MTDAYTAQPLGGGGRALVIDRLSVAWLGWRGISLLSAIDLIVDMSGDARRRPWAPMTRIASVRDGLMVADTGTDDTEHELEMTLVGVRASVGARLSDDVTLERAALRISMGMPDVYAAGLAGRPLGDVVAMPFPFEAVIDEARKTAGGVVVTMRDPWIELPIRGLTRSSAWMADRKG